MADASAALGSAEVAGLLVNPRGLAKGRTLKAAGGQVAGMVGDLAAGAVNARRAPAVPEVPKFGSVGYLAASEDEFVILKTSSMGLKPKPKGEALIRAPRSEMESLELEEHKMVSKLHLRFKDGASWEFDVPRANRNNARQFVEKLGGQTSRS
jgi:hypothetical protein